MKRADVLEWIQWAETHFGSLVTSREVPRRDVLRCVKRGLVKSVGPVPLCDADGFRLAPERYREGFILTDRGRAALGANQ